MKRDNDLIRSLLLKYEADKDWMVFEEGNTTGASDEELREGYHQQLMCDLGLLAYVSDGVYRLTSYGHDYLDSVRDESIWNRTKDGAKATGGVAFGVLYDLAKAYVKQEIADRTGVKF